MNDDYILEMLWQAQMGNTDYPFEPQVILAKSVPACVYTQRPWHSWYESR